MPKPTQGDVHVNRPLTNVSVAFMQDAANFVADKVFPLVPVTNKSDLFFTYDRGEFNRDEMQERAPSTESAGGGFKVGTDSYNAKVYAFHKDIDDQIRGNADAPLNLDADAAKYVTLKALIQREKKWVNTFFKTGVWTTDKTGVASNPTTGQVLQWDNSNSNPILDVRTGKAAILESTGLEPQVLVLGYKTWQKLQDHPAIVDRIKYTGTGDRPGMVTEQSLAELFQLQKVYVMKAIENTAKEGQANASSFIAGNHAMLCYAAPSAGIMQPTAGYTFAWTGYFGASANGTRIKRIRMEWLNSDRVEIEMAYDMKKVSADLGYFFNTIVSA